MENRERDKISQSRRPTEAGDINRDVSERSGRDNDSSADFGQSIGRSEELNTPDRDRNDRERVDPDRSRDDESGSSSGRH